MRAFQRYALAATGFLVVVTAAAWPWLDAPGRLGILAAAALVLPVQLVAFGLLVRYRWRLKAFLAAWVGGMVARMVVVLGAGLALIRLPEVSPAAALLSLAGFFFALLLLESPFLAAGSGDAMEV